MLYQDIGDFLFAVTIGAALVGFLAGYLASRLVAGKGGDV